ncbi:MAG: hypothetical protein KatS3mg108_0477 [Isosphaeraceae bacterium]|jgi:MinD-like ATPase involved in chromosome partitioning or flagellar assembly|nr:MAG: hypothetical protein KatS3mg108_0477 [Isosphaeraceae bacterium]
MSDQADGLRQLVRAQRGWTEADPRPTGTPRRLLLVGAKGGVGTSTLAANLALALAARGRRVGAFALGSTRPHLRLWLGSGRPAVLAPIVGPRETADLPDADELVIDAGTDVASLMGEARGLVAVVTTPEPPSLGEARSLLRRLAAIGHTAMGLVVNQAESAAEARECLSRLVAWCRLGLGVPVRRLGYVRRDPRVACAVRAGRPFLLAAPRGPASRDVNRMARRLLSAAASPELSAATPGRTGPAASPWKSPWAEPVSAAWLGEPTDRIGQIA